MGGRKTRHPETGGVPLACPGFNDKNAYHRQTPCDPAPIDTIVPLRTNMDLYADAIGLTRRRGFAWEPYAPPAASPPPTTASPRPAALEKREAKHQRTLAKRKTKAAACAPPAAPLPVQSRLGLGRGMLGWSQCPVPLTAVVNRERDTQGHTQDWVLVTTSDRFTAPHIRSTYELRPPIEERHRQYKCFWDLTRMHSCAFALVVNQTLFVLLADTLVQAHLVLRQRQALPGGVWERAWQLLSPTLQVVAVYYRQRFCLLTLAEYSRILLDIAEPARGQLREKLRRIEREQYSLLETARSP